MDIKDSYLHSTVGVVKSIDVDADILKYTLADVIGTVKEVTLPTATQSANGLLSKEDKVKLDNMIATKVVNDLTLKINSGTTEDTSLYTYNGSAAKTLDIKLGSNITLTAETNSLTITASDTKVTQTNTTSSADYRVLFSGSANDTNETTTARKSANLLFNPSTGKLTAKGFIGEFLTKASAGIANTWRAGTTMAWFPHLSKTSDNYAGDNTGFPVNSNANGILWLGTHPGLYGWQMGFSSNSRIYARCIKNNLFPTTVDGGSWSKIAWTSDIPTKTSQLTNDSGFLTQHLSLANYVTLDTALTITGSKTFTASTNTFSGTSAGILTVDRNSTNPVWVKFCKNGTIQGYIGITNDFLPVFLSGESGASNKILIHSGNYTSYLPFLNSTSTHATKSSVIYAPTTAGTYGSFLVSNGSGAPFWSTLKTRTFSFDDNQGRDTYLLIADLSNWKPSTTWDTSLIGTIYGHRVGNLNLTHCYNIVAQCTSVAGITTTWRKLYTTTWTYGTVLPYIVKYNDKNYLALKKQGSGFSIYFIGYITGLLSSSNYITLNVPANKTLPDGMEIVHSPSFESHYITTNKLFDGESGHLILHSGNYTSYINTTNFPGLNSIGDITEVIAGDGLSGGGTSGSVTLTNAGVRSTTINGNYLRVNTNGTNTDLTIPYAVNADTVDNLHATSFAIWRGDASTDSTATDTSSTSTADFFAKINATSGLFNSRFGAMRGSWWYVGNTQLNTGVGTLDMAGTAVLNLGSYADTNDTYKSLLFLDQRGRLWSYTANETSVKQWSRYAKTTDIPNPANYYWANVKVSSSSNSATTPTFATATATTSVTTPLVTSTGRLILNATSTGLDLKFNNDGTKSVILNGTAFKPFDAATGALNLGTSTARWKGLYAGTGNFTGLTSIRKDLGGNLSDWINKQHNGPLEVGRSTNTMCVAIGVTDDNYGYIQCKGNGITSNGNLVLQPSSDGILYATKNLYTILHSGNSSVSKSGQTLTVKINGVEQSLTNTTYSSLKSPNAIKFKNTAGTTITYDGSSAADLTGGVNYAASAGSVAWSNITDKPTFAAVAISGSYNDLSNKPAIPTVGDGTVTIKQGGTTKGSFTMNQSGSTTIALTDTNTNYYHTRAYSSGLKISTGTGVSDMYVPTGTTSTLGVVKQHTAADCTTYTSDEGATTPAAVKKAIGTFVSVSRSLTSGTKIGTITIDGTETELYCQTGSSTDTNVTQTNSTTTTDYRVLLSGSATDTSETTTSYKSSKLKFNPGTGTMSVGGIYSEGALYLTGVNGIIAQKVIKSTVADGIKPMEFISKTKVDNLNADMVDGVHIEWAGSLAASDTTYIAGWTTGGTKLKAVRVADLSVDYATSAGSATNANNATNANKVNGYSIVVQDSRPTSVSIKQIIFVYE